MDTPITHYDVFYGVVLACTMLSNDNTPDYQQDAGAIVDFYCNAFGLPEFAAQWKQSILGTLHDISVLGEREANFSRRATEHTCVEEDLLYDVKGDVLAELTGKFDKPTFFVNPTWFDYAHIHAYNATVRYAQIRAAASGGWRAAARVQGVMLALGIGCTPDVNAAIRRFTQCAYWSDLPSVYMLAYLYEGLSKQQEALRYRQLAQLMQTYLLEGLTEVPASVRADYSDDAIAQYSLIASIHRDICWSYGLVDIDYSFVEVMMSGLKQADKMVYINKYREKQWVYETNPVQVDSAPIGFSDSRRQ